MFDHQPEIAVASDVLPKVPGVRFVKDFDEKYKQWEIRRGFNTGIQSSFNQIRKRTKHKLQQAIS